MFFLERKVGISESVNDDESFMNGLGRLGKTIIEVFITSRLFYYKYGQSFKSSNIRNILTERWRLKKYAEFWIGRIVFY